MRRQLIGRFGYWGTVAALLVMGAGCKDHRISLSHFLQQQKNNERAPFEVSPPEAMVDKEPAVGPYEIGELDILGVSVLDRTGEPLFPAVHARVSEDGTIELPLIGTLKVAGLGLAAAEQKVHEAYVPAFATAAEIHVLVVEPKLTDVFVVGAVATPGLVRLQGNHRNLLYAIAAAGGVPGLTTWQATLRRHQLPEATQTFLMTDPVGMAGAFKLAPLEDGDIVVVEASEPNLIFVGGLVNRPEVQSIIPGTSRTVMQAIAAAGGLRTDVDPEVGTLVRKLPDDSEVHVRLPLTAIARGEAPDIELAAGDILWVPETPKTKVRDFINRNFFIRAGAVVTYNVTGVEYLNRASQQNGTSRSNLQDQYDPFGFLQRNAALQTLQRLGP